MKLTQSMVGLAALAPAAWAIRKFRSEQVTNTPAVATLVKLIGKPLFKWAAGRTLLGRYLDRNAPNTGRFTRDDVDRILEQTGRNYDELAPTAHVERPGPAVQLHRIVSRLWLPLTMKNAAP
ncbi:MAG: hypothetical protein ACE5HV_17140 [Acidobacteriota bacterium]